MTIRWCSPNEAVGDIPPEDLADALQDRIHPTSGRLIASKRVDRDEQRQDNVEIDRLMARRTAGLGERRMPHAPCPVVCPQCGNATSAPTYAGWQWCALRDAWYCPSCRRPSIEPEDYRRYVAGLRAGYADELGGVLAPEDGYPRDPWFVRGVKRGRESAGKDRPEQ